MNKTKIEDLYIGQHVEVKDGDIVIGVGEINDIVDDGVHNPVYVCISSSGRAMWTWCKVCEVNPID